MTAKRVHLPVVQRDEVYETNYATRRAMVDEDLAHIKAAIAACGSGGDEYGRHIVHDKLGIKSERTIYCRRDDGVWSPPAPECDHAPGRCDDECVEARILRETAEVATPGGVRYTTRAVTIPEGRFAECAVTRFPRRYEVSTARFPMASYKPRTAEQLKAAAAARRSKALLKQSEIERAEREAEEERRRVQPELPL